MNGSGRKRPLDQRDQFGHDRTDIINSPNRKIKLVGQSPKVQMSLLSFGFGPSQNGNKRHCTQSSASSSSAAEVDDDDVTAMDKEQQSKSQGSESVKTPQKQAKSSVIAASPAIHNTPKPCQPSTFLSSPAIQTPARRPQPTTPVASPALQTTPMRSRFTPSKQSPQAAARQDQDSILNDQIAGSSEDVPHAHLSYSFLLPKNRKDMNMRSPNDPDYDPKTLYVPPAWVKKETPALQQWWFHKQRNMDAILFFKMGKFYELFNQDAVVGVNELDLKLMKSAGPDKPAHAGFPESSRDKYERLLVEKGYKVIRIEQTETPAMMEERQRTSGLKSGSNAVVMREICQVTTVGTRMLGINYSEFHSAQYQYLLSLYETSYADSDSCEKPARLFGVCFLDVTIGRIFMGQFKDDNNYSNLNVLLAHIAPIEILYERNNLSQETYKTLLKTGARLEALKATKEFWVWKKAISHLKVNRIFSSETGDFEWPTQLKSLFQDGDESQNILSLEPKEEHKYALTSFGAIVYYLHSQLIEKQVLAHASFEIYSSPLDRPNQLMNVPGAKVNVRAPMVMDHVAIRNLEIFTNSSGTPDATLFNSINNCKTHFGQRLLRTWLCSPLCDVKDIMTRQDGVKALMSNKNASLMNEIVHMLSGTKDLERMLSKIKNHCFKSESDTRAIMFDGNQYNKAKVSAFVTLLSNFKRIQKFINSIKGTIEDCDSIVLKRLLSFTTDGGLFPDYSENVKYFDQYFDHEAAQQTGKIIPPDGVNREYDECKASIKEMEDKLEDYLEQQKVRLNCQSLTYFGSAKNRYQLQVPESQVKKVPKDWRLETGRAGFKRYYTSKIDEYFAQLTIYEEQMKRILDSVLAGVFEEFLRRAKLWSVAIECVATLDVLQSMAKFARSLMANDVPVCRPKFISDEESGPVIEYKNGRHPTLVLTNPCFIANDLTLDGRTLLLSGANMGGKSTLMRQTALLVVLAQLGCYVPASEMTLTPVDRIFSRLGASDRLLEGESTFYTELVETSAMLRCATKRSLLLLDELGRGTSTFDGTAIAYSVIKEISTNLKCCCLFSTHYHTLTRDFTDVAEVRLAHMACKIDSETNVDEMSLADPLRENITFLFKVAEGPAARSYGYNVAKLAGINNDLIRDAYSKSKEMELDCKVLAALQSVCRQSADQLTPSCRPADLGSRVLAALKSQ